MMKDHVSGHGTTLSVSGSPDHSKAACLKEEKEKCLMNPGNFVAQLVTSQPDAGTRQ